MPKVIYETRDRIAYVTLNRPEVKNAIDGETNELLWRAFEAFRDDPHVDLAIVTGAGDAFCAGADLKTFIPAWLNASAWRVRQNVATGLGGITRGLHRITKPVIAAVNGWALAAGFELALACDIRIASDTARFGSFEACRGFHHMDSGRDHRWAQRQYRRCRSLRRPGLVERPFLREFHRRWFCCAVPLSTCCRLCCWWWVGRFPSTAAEATGL